MPVYRGLMNRLVTVRVVDECRFSPVHAAIQPASRAGQGDEFFVRWPAATHRLWCAAEIELTDEHLLFWLEEDRSEMRAQVLAPREPGDGNGREPVPLLVAPLANASDEDGDGDAHSDTR